MNRSTQFVKHDSVLLSNLLLGVSMHLSQQISLNSCICGEKENKIIIHSPIVSYEQWLWGYMCCTETFGKTSTCDYLLGHWPEPFVFPPSETPGVQHHHPICSNRNQPFSSFCFWDEIDGEDTQCVWFDLNVEMIWVDYEMSMTMGNRMKLAANDIRWTNELKIIFFLFYSTVSNAERTLEGRHSRKSKARCTDNGSTLWNWQRCPDKYSVHRTIITIIASKYKSFGHSARGGRSIGTWM